MHSRFCSLIITALLLPIVAVASSHAEEFSLEQQAGVVRILNGDQQVAEYVYHDPKIGRPYFANLSAANGKRLTRNHPPIAGEDRMDHPEYHPGLWLAFGDLSGTDNWRLKATVQHMRFLEEPIVEDGVVTWQVENRYAGNDKQSTICRDRSRYTLRRTEYGILLTWDSKFTGESPFWFGDQEEMGLGIRMATPLRVEQGGPDPATAGTGEIIDNQGRRNAEQIWGKAARWIDYRGELDGQPAGIALFCHPDNFRASRMHARDYGYLAANPFALAAFGVGEPSRVTVQPGESLRLQYGVLLHAGQALSPDELENAYHKYTRISGQ